MAFEPAAVLSILSLFFAVSVQELSTNKNFVKICTLEHNVTALRLFQDHLLAGTENAVYNYGLDMNLIQKISLPSESDAVLRCQDALFPTCENYIKVILPIPNSNKILVCGTNAYKPMCSLHYQDQLDNFTRYQNTTNQNTGYSTHESDRPIFALVASNQRFFSATKFKQLGSLSMGMSPDPLQSNRRVNITVSAKADNSHLDLSAAFVAVHEYGDYIYFFLQESASSFELGSAASTDEKPLLSKVIRICKRDNGINSMTFSTFQKARIECSNRVGSSATYVYNEIAATFMASENGEQVLYATFNAPRNGPTGGAICKYSFASSVSGSLSNVFEDGNYYVQDSETNSWEQMQDGPSVNCTSGTWSAENTKKYVFAFNTVTAIQDGSNQDNVRPLVRVDGEVLGKIAVETLTYKGSRQEVLYYSNQLGQIKQIVLASDITYSYSLLEDVDMGENDRYEAVQSILLQKKVNNSGSTLYVNRGRKIIQIERGACQQYSSCQECLEFQDPYCGWHQGATPSCVNKMKNQNLDLVESFSATASDLANICGVIVQPPPQTASSGAITFSEVPPNPGSDKTTEESDQTLLPPSSNPLSNGSIRTNIAAVIGAAVGTFILGLFLGLFICFIFFARVQIIKKRQTYQVQDKTKSNNLHQDGTVPDKIDLEAVTAAETKEVYRPNNATSTPRYVDHALQQQQQQQQQQVQPQLPGSEVKTNVIEVGGNGTTQNNVMDASPVKVGNGHIVGIGPSTASQPAMAEAGNNSDTAVSKVNSVPSMPATPRTTKTGQNSRLGRPPPIPPVRFTAGCSNTLPHNRHGSKAEISRFNFATDNNDDAFAAETDVVPPLVNMNTTRFNSLGRNKSGGTSGIARRQVPNYKLPKGRTDSTTWLRQESVSSDVSPLQSPISDV